MDTFLSIMLAPFVECLILVGLHSYLGLHVLRRRVVFVDLSLAQIAALGTTVGIVFGVHDTESSASFLMAVLFTVLGAALFSLTRIRDDRVPQEAVIGLVYAITAAVAVLVVEKTHGVEHLVNIMHGRLLWVRWHEVAEAAAIYAVLGGVHWALRKPFLRISEDPAGAFADGMKVRWWDFLFYVTFGLTIAVSVKVAGVLLVFVFLVAPAILGMLLTRSLRGQLLIGWAAGVVVTTVGLGLSWFADLPTGPAVVSLYGVVLLLVGVVWYLARAPRKGPAFAWVGAGAAGLAAVSGVIALLGSWLATSPLAGDPEGIVFHEHEDEHADAAVAAAPEPPPEPVAPAAPLAPVADDLTAAYRAAETDFDRWLVVEGGLSTDRPAALDLAVVLLSDSRTSPFVRASAVERMNAEAGEDLGFAPEGDPIADRAALDRLRLWACRQAAR